MNNDCYIRVPGAGIEPTTNRCLRRSNQVLPLQSIALPTENLSQDILWSQFFNRQKI